MINDSAKKTTPEQNENGYEKWTSRLRYTKSFLAKLYLSDRDLKEIYCALFNKFSEYVGVSECTAFSGVTFSVKRKPLAKVVFSGKKLAVYFAIDPSTHSDGKYKLTEVKNVKKYSAFPSKYRIRSNGGLKFALSVADEVIANFALEKKAEPTPATYKDFPTDSFSNLVSRGLIRQINLPKRSEYGKSSGFLTLRYVKSFLAKLYLSDRDLKEAYCIILNKFAAYKNVSERTAFSGVTFSVKRKPLAKVVFSGKKLAVYFAIDPSTHSDGKYKLTEAKSVKKYSALPSKYRIRSNGGLKFALSVADEVIANFALEKKAVEPTPATYKDFPTDSFSNLVSRGLIRQVNVSDRSDADLISDEAAPALSENPIDTVAETYEEGDTVAETYGESGTAAGNYETDGAYNGEPTEQTDFGEIVSDTINTNAALTKRYAEYGELLNSFLGDGEIKFVKKKQIRSVDERWVSAIEDCLPAIDEVLRNPSRFIEETEELLPIERTKKVTTQSIKHLSQHTGLISRIENDMVIPSKLLNVFRDESVMTYENKFVNTLLMRLFDFVTERYETALENGANAVKYEFSFSDKLERDLERGKLSLSLETVIPSDKNEKSRFFGSDLWERVKHLNGIITDYRKSDFAMQMGNASIFPPVVRTNPILKNKNLHQCLELWEFLEGYDDDDGVSVSEEELSVSEIQQTFVREGLAEQYTIFRKFVSLAGAGDAGRADTPVTGNTDVIENSETSVSPNALQPERENGNGEENEIAALVDIALQAESLALNELKEQQEKIRAEREALLREEQEEIPKEEIKSAVDDIPVEYPEYKYEQAEAPAVEKSDEEIDDAETDDEKETQETDENGESVIYVKSFASKLALADEKLKGYYCEIANAFLSRAGVRERTAFDHADFVKGRKTLARVIIIGKSVRVFFALPPETVAEKYRVADKSGVKRYAATPSMLKVRGPRGLKHALELVSLVCDGLNTTAPVAVKNIGDYPEKSFAELLSVGEIRRKVVSRSENSAVADKIRSVRPAGNAQKYDYSEEVAEYIKKSENKKGKKIVLKTVTPSEIVKAVKQVDEAERSAAEAEKAERDAQLLAEKAKRDAELQVERERISAETGGDPLYFREEADIAADDVVTEIKPEKKQERQKSDASAEVPAGGDVLAPKPITMEEISRMNDKRSKVTVAEESLKNKTEKRGLFARLFGKKDKK